MTVSKASDSVRVGVRGRSHDTRAQDRPSLREWLAEAPFSLTLSAGFFGFFAHAGVMSVLEDEGLLPVRISGASAGALVGGLWAAGVDAQLLQRELFALRRADFWDPAFGVGLLRGKLFRERLEALLPVTAFESCRVPLAVSAYDLWARRTRVLAAGPLALGIQASCTLPGLFHPTIYEGRPLLDGGILDRPGLLGVPAGERILYHHLVSKSPWRAASSVQLRVPERAGLVGLAISGIPRVGPFRLEVGALAFAAARRGARAALDKPVRGCVVSVEA